MYQLVYIGDNCVCDNMPKSLNDYLLKLMGGTTGNAIQAR